MMYKPHFFCWALLLGSLSAGGCVSTVHEPAEEATPISFATTATRGAVDADKNGMDRFWVWGGTDPDNNLFDAETVSPDGSYAGTRYWVPGRMHAFYALHPASLNPTPSCQKGVITVTNFNASTHRGTNAVDLMTAQATGLVPPSNAQPDPVILTFQHELTRVRFLIKTKSKVTISDVKLEGIDYIGTFTTDPTVLTPWTEKTGSQTGSPFLQTGKFTLQPQEERYLLAGQPENGEGYGDLLMIPQNLDPTQAHFSMSWTYGDGWARTVRVPLTSAGTSTWERGKSYLYAATIPAQSSEVTLTVQVGDWNRKRVDVELEEPEQNGQN